MDPHKILKTIILESTGAIPEVGKTLSKVIAFLWPEPRANTPQDTWNDIKSFAKELMQDLITEERLVHLEQQLEGLKAVLKQYERTPYDSPQKGQYFTSVLSYLEAIEPFFLDPRQPEKQLPFFVALGTLKLSVLREQYLFFDKIYHTKNTYARDHLEILQETIERYLDTADLASTRAMQWRLDKLSIQSIDSRTFRMLGPVASNKTFVFDSYDNWAGEVYLYNSNTGSSLERNKRFVEEDYERRKTDVRRVFGSQLEAFLTASTYWRYFNPNYKKRPVEKPEYFTTGPFGPRKGTFFEDANPNDTPITKITVRAGSRVDGVQFEYGGRAAELHGGRGGAPNSIYLAPDEYVTEAYGRSGGTIDQLFFKTNKGQTVGGGGTGGQAWSAELHPGINAKLVNIYGYAGHASLEQITLQWVKYVSRPVDAEESAYGAAAGPSMGRW